MLYKTQHGAKGLVIQPKTASGGGCDCGDSPVYIYKTFIADRIPLFLDFDAGTYVSGDGVVLNKGTIGIDATTGMTTFTNTGTKSVSGLQVQKGFSFNSDQSSFIALIYSIDQLRNYSLSTVGDVTSTHTLENWLALGADCYGWQILEDGTKLIAVFVNTYKIYTLGTAFDLSTATLDDTITHGLAVSGGDEQLIGFEEGGGVVWVADRLGSENIASVYARKCPDAYDMSTIDPKFYLATPKGELMKCSWTNHGATLVGDDSTGFPAVIYRQTIGA